MSEEKEIKILFYIRICAICCIGLLAISILVAVLVIPAVLNGMEHITQVVQELEQVEWGLLSTALTDSLTQLSQSLKELDIDSLNQAVRDLQTAISPLVRLFGG